MRKRFKRDLPELDPETDMSITDSDYRKAQRKSETLESLIAKHPLAHSSTLQERLTSLRHKQVKLKSHAIWPSGLVAATRPSR